MNEITNTTIIGNNISTKILDDYKSYQRVTNNFAYEELIRYKRVIFYNVLNKLDEKKVKDLYKFLIKNNILFINVTNNIEHTLLTDNLIIYKDNIEKYNGTTKELLAKPKIFQGLGLAKPFIIELSELLKYYDLVDKTYYDKESLGEYLWK